MGGITIYITWGTVIIFVTFFFIWISYWFKNRKKYERLATLAQHVVADLLRLIDTDENWNVWTRDYREMFSTKSCPYIDLNSLADGLDELSTLIKRTQESKG